MNWRLFFSELEPDSEDKEKIEHIFRIMHTLKGNSAMFGFNLIDQYTHQLETIYDLIRNGKMKISSDLMDLTLASVDHIKNLLDEESNLTAEVLNTHKTLLERISLMAESGSQTAKKSKTVQKEEKAGIKTYYIHFQPHPEILKNGTNPLYLVEDFKTLGECIAISKHGSAASSWRILIRKNVILPGK